MTSTNSLETIIQQSLASLFQCAQIPHSGLLRIRTPFQYPDGSVVDIFVEPRPDAEGEYAVSDMGDAWLFLSIHTPEGEPSPLQIRLADEIRSTIGVEEEHGLLKAKASGRDRITAAVLKIAQAACQISVISFCETEPREEHGNGIGSAGPETA